MRLLSKNLFFLILLCFFVTQAVSQVTYTKDIAPIIYNNCMVCHRSGEIGPMSLTNYEEVRNWGETIRAVTAIKYMPPWKPDPEYSSFLGENYLTDEEIDLIAQWVEDGKPEGNTADLPPFPDFPEGSVLGEPDLVVSMAQSYVHKGNNQDEYRYFVIPSGLTEDKVLKAMELRPGNKQIVHHALVFEDTSGKARENDAATPEYGFDGFGGFAGDDTEDILSQKQFPGYVPGQKPIFYPDGLGQTISAGSDLVIQMHYAPWPVDEIDSSSINLFFAPENETFEREVRGHIMVPLFSVINELFAIYANQVKAFHGIWEIPEDISLIGLAPHMHLLGKDWEVYLERPDGSTTNLIRINEWDFNWQGSFYFDRFYKAEKGSKIHAIATYDNTVNNPNNPNNPPRFVTWGEGTEDEMYYLPIYYVSYKEGDEDIRFDDPLSSLAEQDIRIPANKIYPLYPNPTDGYINIGFSLERATSVSIQLLDASGQLIRKIRPMEFFNSGNNIVQCNTTDLEQGMYIIHIEGKNFQLSKSFIKS